MSVFEDFFEDFMFKAKSVAGTASRVTGEAIDMGKINYQIKQTQWDVEKTYAKLGAIVYESKKSTESFDEVIDLAVGEIDALNEKIEQLEAKLRSYKKVTKCSACGRENDNSFQFCSRCGEPLVQEDPPQPVEAEVVEPQEEAGPQEPEAPKSAYYPPAQEPDDQ